MSSGAFGSAPDVGEPSGNLTDHSIDAAAFVSDSALRCSLRSGGSPEATATKGRAGFSDA